MGSSGRTESDVMTKEQKVIRGKIGLLELAKQLGNVSQACSAGDANIILTAVGYNLVLAWEGASALDPRFSLSVARDPITAQTRLLKEGKIIPRTPTAYAPCL
jgi:hypothetical protein